MRDRTDALDTKILLSVEFILASGETFTVRHESDDRTVETAIDRLGESLLDEMGNDTVRKFTYFDRGSYVLDAVSMSEVVGFSISEYDEADDEDYDDAE